MTSACAQCGTEAEQRCSRCHQVYYCGRQHQKDHWAQHRDDCRPYKVCADGALGRHLVATRALPAGACVLREAPVVSAPPFASQLPTCVVCYAPLGRGAPLCPRGCGWPLCAACARPGAPPPAQHREECKLRTSQGKPADVLGALAARHPVHQALAVTRCLLLRDSAPAAYARLLALEAHCAKRQASGQWARDRDRLAHFLLPFFGLEQRFTDHDVLYMAGVLQINTYPVLGRDRAFTCIYDEASMVEHACVANTAKVFGAGGELLLRTAVPVRRGEHLSICYVSGALGTAPRRAALADELLDCACARCADATEMGTGFSALVCEERSCSGSVLPEAPLQPGSAWRCSACGRREAAEAAAALAAAAEALPPAQRLARARDLRLGANHFLLLEARERAAVAAGACADAEEELRRLKRLADTLVPAEQGLRGRLRLALGRVLVQMHRRGDTGADAHSEARLEEAKRLLEEALVLLGDFPEDAPEAAIHRAIRLELEGLEETALRKRVPEPAVTASNVVAATAAS